MHHNKTIGILLSNRFTPSTLFLIQRMHAIEWSGTQRKGKHVRVSVVEIFTCNVFDAYPVVCCAGSHSL